MMDLTQVQQELAVLAKQDCIQPEQTQLLQQIADASRQSPELRTRLGSSTVADVLVRTIRASIDQDDGLCAQALRCLGNGIVDNQDAILYTTVDLSWLRSCLSSPNKQVQTLAIKVLYNICAVDFEDGNPAWQLCYQQSFYIPVLDKLVTLSAADDDIELLVNLLLWTTSPAHASQSGLQIAAGDEEHVWPLIEESWFSQCASQLDAETLACLVEGVVTLLGAKDLYGRVIAHGKLINVLRSFTALEKRLSAVEDAARDVDMAGAEQVASTDMSEAAADLTLLRPLITKFIWLLSDLSDLPGAEEGTELSLDDPVVMHVLAILQTSSTAATTDHGLQAACLVLGNILLCRSSAATLHLLANTNLASILLATILRPDATSDLLHAAAGLLTVLCRPSIEVRERIAQLDTLEPAMRKLCLCEVPAVAKGGIRALQELGKDVPAIQARFTSLMQEAQTRAQQSASAGVETSEP